MLAVATVGLNPKTENAITSGARQRTFGGPADRRLTGRRATVWAHRHDREDSDELERWYALSEERQRGRARSWLTAAGYRVLPAARRDP